VKRFLVSGLAVAAVLAVSACGHSNGSTANTTPTTVLSPTPGSGTVSSPPATPASGPSSPGVPEFTVDGTGLYEIGAKLADAQAAGLANVTTGSGVCPQDTVANGVGAWKDVQFTFGSDGVLFLAVNKSSAIPTPSGAWLGTNVAQLKTIYAGIQADPLTFGGHNALLVTTLSGRGILFDLNAAGNVQAMTAGDATYLKTNYQSGKPFC
jgi:hypothetical protein